MEVQTLPVVLHLSKAEVEGEAVVPPGVAMREASQNSQILRGCSCSLLD